MAIFMLIAGIILLFGFYINRESPKIQETVFILFGILLSAFIYITKEDNLDETIYPSYIINKNSKTVSFVDQKAMPNSFCDFEISKELKSRIEKNEIKIESDMDSALIMQMNSLVGFIANGFHHHWYSKKEVRGPGMGGIVGWPRIDDDYRKDDISSIKITDLTNSLIDADYFVCDNIPIKLFEKINLPKNSRIKFEMEKNKLKGKQVIKKFIITISKKFFYKIELEVSPVGGIIGLGDLGFILAADGYRNDVLKTEHPNVNMWFNCNLEIHCKARFNRFTAYNPDTMIYKKWVKSLFSDLADTYDWSKIRVRIIEDQQIRHLRITNSKISPQF